MLPRVCGGKLSNWRVAARISGAPARVWGKVERDALSSTVSRWAGRAGCGFAHRMEHRRAVARHGAVDFANRRKGAVPYAKPRLGIRAKSSSAFRLRLSAAINLIGTWQGGRGQSF